MIRWKKKKTHHRGTEQATAACRTNMPQLLSGLHKSPSPPLSMNQGSSMEVVEMGDYPILGDHRTYSNKPRRLLRFLDDFKRNDGDRFFPEHHLSPANSRTHSHHDYGGHFAELEIAQSGLARRLKGRHLQMIAISGSIGTFPSTHGYFIKST